MAEVDTEAELQAAGHFFYTETASAAELTGTMGVSPKDTYGVTLDNVQLVSGFVQLVMEVTERCLGFIDKRVLMVLRERLREIGVGICLQDT